MGMNIKKYWVLRNLLGAAAFILVLVFIIQLLLNVITRHNKLIDVPDFSGMSVEEAQHIAKIHNLRLDVTDSIYTKSLEKGAIFSQNPVSGNKVKKNRRILLTINATVAKTVQMPDIVGYSLRQAKTELMSRGLTIGKLIYEPDIATNNVLEQRYKGARIAPGKELEVESAIDLVLGCDDESIAYIPQLRGYTLSVAKDNIWESSLNVGAIRFDETVMSAADSASAVVYRQSPSPVLDAACPMGTIISLYLTVNQAKLAAAKQEEE